MPSMMDHVADVARNGGVELRRLAKVYDFPDFVKSANQDLSLAVPKGTATTTCADPTRQQFWCHTKAACWLSHLFYQEKRAEFHPKDRVQIERRLEQFADFYQIKAACAAIKARWTAFHKEAGDQTPDSAYAYVWVGNDGRKERHLLMRSAMEVKAAAEYVQEHRDAFPYPVRRHMASKILEKAAAFGAALGPAAEFLERQAGRGVCDPAAVVDMIEKRALLVPPDAGVTFDEDGRKSDGLREHFLKMAQAVKGMPRQALQPASMIKLAETMDTLDRRLGLAGKYTDQIPRPEDVIFAATFTKVASDLTAHVATTTGNYYPKAAFTKVALSDVRGLFGDEFADRVGTKLGDIDPEKMAEEVATLPRPDAQMLDNLLSDHGVVPEMRKAASVKAGFNMAQMEAIAAAYK